MSMRADHWLPRGDSMRRDARTLTFTARHRAHQILRSKANKLNVIKFGKSDHRRPVQVSSPAPLWWRLWGILVRGCHKLCKVCCSHDLLLWSSSWPVCHKLRPTPVLLDQSSPPWPGQLNAPTIHARSSVDHICFGVAIHDFPLHLRASHPAALSAVWSAHAHCGILPLKTCVT